MSPIAIFFLIFGLLLVGVVVLRLVTRDAKKRELKDWRAKI